MIYGVLAFIGVASGFTVSAALFALIATIGVLNRLAQLTRSAYCIRWYEICFMMGGIAGNIFDLYQWPMATGLSVTLGAAGLFMGIYIGCFISALAETINVYPILFHRLKIRKGLKGFILAMAIGKSLGGIIDFFV